MKTTTIIRRLTSTDLATKKGHGCEIPISSEYVKTVEQFFEGKDRYQPFSDIFSGKKYELRMTDYTGTQTPYRIAPIGMYRKNKDLQIGDQLILEKVERGNGATEYLIGYFKSAYAVSIYGVNSNKGQVNAQKLKTLLDIKLSEGTATQPISGEYHFNGENNDVLGEYVLKCDSDTIEIFFNKKPLQLKGKQHYEIDFTRYPIKVSDLPDWEIRKNKPLLLSKVNHEEYIEDDSKIIDEIKDIDLVGVVDPYIPSRKRKEALKTSKGGKKIYPRNKTVSVNALKRANHSCEYNPKHKSFIRKNTTIKYMEPHHLIPIQFHEDFDWSLDVEANVVSLCSDCHNQIHYGNGSPIIKKLYKKRKHELASADIAISEKDLLGYYGY